MRSIAACSVTGRVDQLGSDKLVNVVDGLLHALAEIAALVAISKLDCLVSAGGCARRHRRPAHRAVFKVDFYLNRRVAARVQYLTRMDFIYVHISPLF